VGWLMSIGGIKKCTKGDGGINETAFGFTPLSPEKINEDQDDK